MALETPLELVCCHPKSNSFLLTQTGALITPASPCTVIIAGAPRVPRQLCLMNHHRVPEDWVVGGASHREAASGPWGGGGREGPAAPEARKQSPTCRDHLNNSRAAATGGHGSWSLWGCQWSWRPQAWTPRAALLSPLCSSEQLTALL